jgi:hypothetical protein
MDGLINFLASSNGRVVRIIAGIEKYLKENGMRSPRELTGALAVAGG